MSITRIKSYGISDGAITTNKISGDVSLGVKIASVQIANSSYSVLDDTAVALEGGYLVITGSGFASGCQVIVGANTATSTTFVNSTTIRAQVGAADAGTKTLYVVNTDGGTAIRVNGLTYSATPTWVTGSTLNEESVDEAISIQLNASDATSYQVQTGSTLPTGLSLAANGLLSGTVTGIEEETTYSFTIEAIDDENQESPRSFSITITFGDEYFYATTLLLNGDGANGANNNVFIDSSNNNFAITRSGNTTQGSFSPFSAPDGRWSNYFDGTGDYLSNTSSALITAAVNTFTVESWIYMTANPTSGVDNVSGFITLDGQSAGSINYMSFGPISSRILYIRWFDGAAKSAYGSTTLNLNQWYHISCVVNSNAIQFYVNGVAESMSGTTTLTNRSGTSSNFSIGQNNYGAISGYISNLRVTTTAVYTSAFTPSKNPLSSITNTRILTCQSNRFKDNSTNNFTLTPNGNVSVTSFAPFAPTGVYSAATNGGSGIFISDSVDACQIADNDSLSFTSTNSWTVEAWVYHLSHRSYNYFFSKGAGATREYGFGNNSSSMFFYYQQGGDATISHSYNFYLNTWYHLAYTHDGSTIRFFINGELVKSQNWSGTITNTVHPAWIGSFLDYRNISHSFHGYLSDLKYTKGSSLYSSSFTLPTSPAIPTTNTQLLCNFTNAGILDYTRKNVLETVGNAQISTSVKKYGTGSLAFDGTGDYIAINNPTLQALGTGDFTIEMWLYSTSTAVQFPFSCRNSATTVVSPDVLINFPSVGNISWYVSAANQIVGTGFTANTWHHVAICRSSGNTKMFLNGTQVGSTYTDSNNYLAAESNGPFLGGLGSYESSGRYFGYIDDLRITKGIARYTSNFTPPISAHRLK